MTVGVIFVLDSEQAAYVSVIYKRGFVSVIWGVGEVEYQLFIFVVLLLRFEHFNGLLGYG